MLKKQLILWVGLAALAFGLSHCTSDPEVSGSQLRTGEFTTLNTLRFDLSPAEVTQTYNSASATLISTVENIEKIPTDQVTLENTLLAVENASADFSEKVGVLFFLKNVSPLKEVRDSAEAIEIKLNEFFVEFYARENLYARLKALEAKAGSSLGELESRLLKDYLLRFKVNGLDLLLAGKTAEFAEFKKLKKEVADLGTQFEVAINDWAVTVEMTEKELEGLPKGYIEGLKKRVEGENTFYVLGLDNPTYFPFMQNAKNAEARKKLQNAYDKRGGVENAERLAKAVKIRAKLAKMLGYSAHSDVVLEQRMAQNKETVFKFLLDLREKLQAKGKENIAEMLEAKKTDLGEASDGTINAWDWRYYENYLRKNKYKVDNEEVKKYFPHDIVTTGMLDIYQTLLGVKFVTDTTFKTWHEDVMSYRVEDAGKTIAYFFLDMHPRPGKYTHAAMSGFVEGRILPDGSYRVPVAAVMANMPKPAAGVKRALWSHNDVETLFHEFGHVMHGVLTRSKYASFAGTSVKRDFVEAPSQMLENWVWQKESLQKMSGLHTDPSQKLPDDLLNKMLAAKLLNVGIFYLRQLSFGLFDMTIHSSGDVIPTDEYKKQMAETMMIPVQPDTYPEASFGHMMGGYDAGYYGYMWSEVYAADMFTRFEKEGLLSPKAGGDYRKWILEKGGTEDPFALLRGFLGREPNSDAFFKGIGLKNF